MATERWSPSEHALFEEGLKKYGHSWKLIAENCLIERTPEQVRTHFLKYSSDMPKGESTQSACKYISSICFYIIPIWPRRGDNQSSFSHATYDVFHATHTCSHTANPKGGHWTDEEHDLFLECWSNGIRSWKQLAEIIKTRSNEQIRTHAQKYFTKLRELR